MALVRIFVPESADESDLARSVLTSWFDERYGNHMTIRAKENHIIVESYNKTVNPVGIHRVANRIRLMTGEDAIQYAIHSDTGCNRGVADGYSWRDLT